MTSTLKKVMAGISALVILSGAAVGGWAISKYVINDNDMIIDLPLACDDGSVQIGKSESNGVSLMSAKITPEQYAAYGISPLAESAYEITATVMDESGSSLDEIQGVEFSVVWQDSTDETISEYVTLSSEGSVATLSFLKAFSTPIVLTAASVLDSEVTGSTIFDYAKRVVGVNISLDGSEHVISGGETVSVDMPDFSDSPSGETWRSAVLNLTKSGVLGEGTVQGTVTSLRYSITPTSELINALHEANSSLSSVTGKTFVTPGSNGTAISFADVISKTMDESLLMLSQYRSSLYKAFANASEHFDVKLTATISNLTGRTFEFDFKLNFTNSDLKIAEITMSETNVVI